MDSSFDKKLLGFRQIAQEKLQYILVTIPGRKDLVIDESVIKALEHVCGASSLRSNGIEKIYKFDQKNAPAKVLDQIHSFRGRSQSLSSSSSGLTSELDSYHIIVFPTILYSFEQLLEEEGLHGVVKLYRFNWDFIVLDKAILSLEIPQLYKEVFLKRDTSLLMSVAHSLRLFNIVARRPKMVMTYGENAEKIMKMVNHLEETTSKTDQEKNQNSDFTAMLVIDRNKDYVSTLLTPVIYAGLLLEIHNLRAGSLQITADSNLIKEGKLKWLQIPNADKDKKVSIEESGKPGAVIGLRLNGSVDSIYNDNKYRHFSEVISLLGAQAKALGVEGQYSRDMKVNEMKEYVMKKLPKVAAIKKELFKHLTLCETIVSELGGNFEKLQTIEENMITNSNRKQTLAQIDELLSTDAHRYNILRLMALLHVTNGLTVEEGTQFITSYCNTFSHSKLNAFLKLSLAKLFPDTTTASKSNILSNISLPKWQQNSFKTEANKMKLLPSDDTATSTSRKDPVSPSYVFNGTYIPLIAQLSSILLNCENIDELTAKLGHIEQIKITSKLFDQTSRTVKELNGAIKKNEIPEIFPLKPRTLFIFVVGGITYAEIAACNLVEKLAGGKIILASNAIISGSDIISSAFS